MERKIFCFGSSVEGDGAAFDVSAEANGCSDFKFVRCESPIELVPYLEQDELIILDTVSGIRKPKVFRSIDDFLSVESVTTHDLDLGTFLKVLDGMGKINKLSIIGVPSGKGSIGQLRELLSSKL